MYLIFQTKMLSRLKKFKTQNGLIPIQYILI